MSTKKKEEDSTGTYSPRLEILKGLALGVGRKLPVILQTESMECGLACIAMISGFHGNSIDLTSLRRKFAISLKGVTLDSIMKVAGQVGLSTRAVRLELTQLNKLKMPCILHWEMSHFVVMKSVRRNRILIHDPSVGERSISMKDLSCAFSGVALELWPGPDFAKHDETRPVSIRSLLGNVTGLSASFAQIIAIAFVLQILGFASPLFMQWVIDHALAQGNRELLATLVLAAGALLVVSQFMFVLSAWTSMYLSTTWGVQWGANIFGHLLRLPLSYFEQRHLGDITSRFGSASTIQGTLTAAFIGAIVDGVMLIFAVIVIFLYSPMLSWISIAAMGFYALTRVLRFRPVRLAIQEQVVNRAKQDSHFLETVRGARTVKLFQNHDIRLSTWLALVVDQVNSGLKIRKLQILFSLINGLAFGLAGLVTIWMAAQMVLRGEFTIGMMTAFVAYQMQFSRLTTSLIDKYFEVKMLGVHAERLADIVLTEPERRAIDTRLVVSDNGTGDSGLELSALRFRYSLHDPFVLDGIDLKVEPGESVAITGPSGCGKTTLLHIVLGILSPTEGKVQFGGVSIADVDPQVLRSNIASVTQNDSLFAGSMADNISFFDAQRDQRWIEECARMASIHDEIVAMPMAYNTSIGYMGSALSGGQQQRVLLARALYRRPKILILDEATSHLDIRREAMVNAAVRSLNITRMIVAHRPQTAEFADRIILLEHGRVTAERRSSPGMSVVVAGIAYPPTKI